MASRSVTVDTELAGRLYGMHKGAVVVDTIRVELADDR